MTEHILPGGWRRIASDYYEDASGTIDVELLDDTLEVGVTDGDGATSYGLIPLEIVRLLLQFSATDTAQKERA